MPVIVQNFLWLIDGLRLMLTSDFNDRFDFNPLKMVTYLISEERKFLIEIGSVADPKIKIC